MPVRNKVRNFFKLVASTTSINMPKGFNGLSDTKRRLLVLQRTSWCRQHLHLSLPGRICFLKVATGSSDRRCLRRYSAAGGVPSSIDSTGQRGSVKHRLKKKKKSHTGFTRSEKAGSIIRQYSLACSQNSKKPSPRPSPRVLA